MGCASFCFKLLALGGILVVPAAYLYAQASATAQQFQGSGSVNAVNHCAAMAVRDGVETGRHATPTFADFARDAAAAMWYILQSFFGCYHLMHRSFLAMDLSRWRFPTDAEGTFCRDVLGYMWVHPVEKGFSYPAVYAEGHDINDWIRVCRAEYASLGEEERTLLMPFRAAGAVPLEVLMPELEDHDGILHTSRKLEGTPALDDPGRKLSADDISKMLRDSIASSSWAGVVDEPPEGILEYLTKLNLREPVRIPSDWAEVGAAVKAGRTVVFDAGRLLPDGLVNVSMASIAQQEGDRASRIAIWHDGCKASPLDKFAAAREAFIQAGANAKEPWNVAAEKMIVVNGSDALDAATFQKVIAPVAPHLGPVFAPCRTGYVHTRRLPRFHERLPEIEEPLGIKEDVLRAQSMLWLGSTPGGFHYDEEANVYIQLTGESFAFLVPQNFTDVMTGSQRHPWGSAGLPSRSTLAADPLLREIPIYLVHLRPGDGITLQGREYHRFMAQTQDRVALNWFFIPRWRRMEYTLADWYSKEARRSLPRLALRQLWARTLSRLWDEAGKGVIYMGGKLEYL